MITPNLLIMELYHLNDYYKLMDNPEDDYPLSNKVIECLGFGLVSHLHYIIITDINKGVFYYVKNRSSGEVDNIYNLEELSSHIGRITKCNNKLSLFDHIANFFNIK